MSGHIRAFVHLSDGRTPGGTRIGAVAQVGPEILFEYTPQFLASGRSLSPIMLPLTKRVFRFNELRDQAAFHGLPGLLADSLPDRFGTRLIEAHFQQAQGLTPGQLSPVQRLLYIGDRAIGALTYQPAMPEETDGIREAITLQRLREQAWHAIAGDTPTALAQIMAAASSAGGMRAKALVNRNMRDGSLRIGRNPGPDEEAWMIKFDGVGEDSRPQVWTRLEYAYNEMARAAGIRMPPSCLIDADEYRHFATRRFDITADNRRLHVHSLCGLQHADFNQPGLVGYELLMQSCLDLGLGGGALREAFRRMAFNVVACNQDDHTKNIAFVMDPATFSWDLAPAYDITYAHGSGYSARHQMTVNGKDSDIGRDDLMAVARQFCIPGAQAVLDQVGEAVSQWPRYADMAGLPALMVRQVSADLRLAATLDATAGPGRLMPRAR